MPSGKQVLLHFLKKYSLAFQEQDKLSEVSEDLRVAFLLHGSTPDDMWYNVDNIEWGNETDEEGKVTSQGLKIKDKKIMLSELFEYLTWDDEKIPNRISEEFMDLTLKEYKSAVHVIWLVLTSIEYSDWLSEVENNGKMDFEALDKYLVSYRKKMRLFRENPNDFLGSEE